MQTQQQDTEWRGNRRQLFQKTKDVAITAGKVALAMSPVAVFLARCGGGVRIYTFNTLKKHCADRDVSRLFLLIQKGLILKISKQAHLI